MPTMQFEESLGVGLLAVLAVAIAALILIHTWSKRPKQEGAVGGEGGDADAGGVSDVPGNVSQLADADQLVNYYILASYNTCCEGNYEGGTVSTAQIRKVLKEGARFVDFAIYTMPESCTGDGTQDEPAVAGSASASDLAIGTRNCLPLTDVMREVASTAFSAGRVPRPTEPLLLHCRLRTRQPETLTQLGHLIKREFGTRLLPAGRFGGNATHGPATTSILSTPLAELRGKCIVILESPDRSWTDNIALASVVNIAQGAGEPFFVSTPAPILRATATPGQMRETNKQQLTLITPTTDSGGGPVSFPIGPALWIGCQLPAVAFQVEDENKRAALDYFKSKNSGFVLKPAQLQQKIIRLPHPKAQDPKLSYALRTKTAPYFKFNV
jgi:hypothetical protein